MVCKRKTIIIGAKCERLRGSKKLLVLVMKFRLTLSLPTSRMFTNRTRYYNLILRKWRRTWIMANSARTSWCFSYMCLRKKAIPSQRSFKTRLKTFRPQGSARTSTTSTKPCMSSSSKRKNWLLRLRRKSNQIQCVSTEMLCYLMTKSQFQKEFTWKLIVNVIQTTNF